ncbi:hypothetical protein QJS66_20105 [Kocuria rhizophila]|nr:hypothetical protein QJS66_20105 [Kocuria rhizophila]
MALGRDCLRGPPSSWRRRHPSRPPVAGRRRRTAQIRTPSAAWSAHESTGSADHRAGLRRHHRRSCDAARYCSAAGAEPSDPPGPRR